MSIETNSSDNWQNWGQHVLRELVRLNTNIEELRKEQNDLKAELHIMRNQEKSITDIKEWKEKIDEVTSPTQLKELKDEVDKLRTFKTVATTVFIVIQTLFTIVVTIIGLVK